MSFIQEASYLASRALKNPGLRVSLSRAQVLEVVSAALGYRTYAALLTEDQDASLDLHLEDAEVIVLNPSLAARRLVELVPTMESNVADAVASRIADAIGEANPDVLIGIKDFWSNHLEELTVDTMTNSDEVYSAQAELNAHEFASDAELDGGCPDVEGLWRAEGTWSITANGTLVGSYDPDGDRMFNGDSITCSATLKFQKAGRAGLRFDEALVSAQPDDSWRGDDREDEANY